MIPVLENVWDRFIAKKYHPVSLVVISKVSKIPVNNTRLDHIEKCGWLQIFLFKLL